MPRHRIAVKTGQRYRVKRNGGPARHVVVARVERGPETEYGIQPVAKIYEVTRTGNRKGPQRVVARYELKDGEEKPKTVPNTVPHRLVFEKAKCAWTMGPHFALEE